MNLFYFILKGIKRVGLKLKIYSLQGLKKDYTGQEASDLIKSKLLSSEPCMICRYGSTELNAVLKYEANANSDSFFQKCKKYLFDDIYEFWIDDFSIKLLRQSAGFFPATRENLINYGKLMIEESKKIDILGSWIYSEKFLSKYYQDIRVVRLKDLEPYYHKNPWTVALKDKKVLVIHPFAKTIQKQYENRKKLFDDERILPDFTLLTYKPVQTIADSEANEFETAFDALAKMKNDIKDIDFDIAIIGAGAYGFLLAGYIKEIGKKAIHLGGATQILFGIKGKRWEDKDFFKKLFNDNWVRPSVEDQPKGFKKVENGCYW